MKGKKEKNNNEKLILEDIINKKVFYLHLGISQD